MKYSLILVMVICFFGLKAQKIYDAEAEQILKEISLKIKSQKQVNANFSFSVDYLEAEEDVNQGKLIQNSDSYFVSIGDNEIISTSTGFYVIDKVDKVVQINDALDDEATDLYNPISLMEKYDSGEFEYAIVGEEMVEGKNCVLIEFKPTDRYSDLSKIRIAIDSKEKDLKHIKIFNKDASKIEINIEELELSNQLTDPISFDKSVYEGYVIEDLRID